MEYWQDLHACFVDFEKVFDQVEWKQLTDKLKKLDIGWRDGRRSKKYGAMSSGKSGRWRHITRN